MQITPTEYNPELLKEWKTDESSSKEISEKLQEFLAMFISVFGNKTRVKNFGAYIKGLLSKLKRKSIEPIALEQMGESGVRTLQNFITRSNFDDEKVHELYQKKLAETISGEGGMLSVDGCDNPKKGKHSPGVKRQYCGCLGKVENCQANVFVAYAARQAGYGLVDRELYIPKEWFGDSHKELRKECQIPDEKEFKTKNEIALEMIKKTLDKNLFNVKWIGADAAFGCDHGFLDGLPETAYYFVGTNCKERVFLPSSDTPTTVESLAKDDSFGWEQVAFDSSKGISYSSIKIIRCFSCRTIRNKATKHHDIWLYIRRYKNGDTKYFLTNAPEDMPHEELHAAATLRWPIEQCFKECKDNLGLADFEGRSYNGFMRHLLFVMIAHFFCTSLRLTLKKTASQ